MPYTKTTWANSPATTTPLSAANLSNMETQYDQAIADCVNVSGDTMTGTLTINAPLPATLRSTAAGGGTMLHLSSTANAGTINNIYIYKNNAPVNQKTAEIVFADNAFVIRNVNDAYTEAYEWLTAYKIANSHVVEHVDITASSYIAIGSPNVFLNNLYVQQGYVRVQAAAPVSELWSTNSTGGFQRWQWIASANNLHLRCLNEAGGIGSNDIMITRDFAQLTALVIRNNGTPVITLNATNGVITSTGGTAFSLAVIKGYQAHLRIYDTAAGTENKGWDFYNLSNTLSIRTVNDAENSHGPNRVDFGRSGNLMTQVRFVKSGVINMAYDFPSEQLQFKARPSHLPQITNMVDGSGINFDEYGGGYLIAGGFAARWIRVNPVVARFTIKGQVAFDNLEAITSAPGPRTQRLPVYNDAGTFMGYMNLSQS